MYDLYVLTYNQMENIFTFLSKVDKFNFYDCTLALVHNVLSQVNRVSGASRWHGCNSIPRSVSFGLSSECVVTVSVRINISSTASRANRASTDSTSAYNTTGQRYKELRISIKRESP